MRIHTLFFMLAVILFAACKKGDIKPTIAPERISLERSNTADTLMRDMHAGYDSAVVVGLKAVLKDGFSTTNHHVLIRTDSTRMIDYVSRYGTARLLPNANFLLYRSLVDIKAGATISDDIVINVIKQSGLRQLTNYVLPIVIDEIDGNAISASREQVVFLVIKTGKGSTISKIDWTIHSFSGQATNSYPVTNVLDNSLSTFWMTGAGMPQYVTFNFGDEIIFSGVTYDTNPSYFDFGGHPTKVRIEVSMDAINWVDKGLFNGVSGSYAKWTQNIGQTTARYMRFTIVEVEPFLWTYQEAYMTDISLIP